MKKIQEKIQKLEKQIVNEKVETGKKVLISEMKKIGIEKLPYSYSALKNFIDPETMNVHYNKHYKGYVDKLNKSNWSTTNIKEKITIDISVVIKIFFLILDSTGAPGSVPFW